MVEKRRERIVEGRDGRLAWGDCGMVESPARRKRWKVGWWGGEEVVFLKLK